RRVLDRQDLEFVTVDGDALLGGLDLAVQIAENRAVLQQVRQCLRVGEVVDRYEIDVLLSHGRAHDVASDATEPVDSNPHRHRRSSVAGPLRGSRPSTIDGTAFADRPATAPGGS